MPDALVIHPADPSARVRFGLDTLARALADAGYAVARSTDPLATRPDGIRILLGIRGDSADLATLEHEDILLYNTGAPEGEGFVLSSLPGTLTVVVSGSDSGLLYGCQELARQIAGYGDIPRDLDLAEAPDLVLRGPAIGLQKTTVEAPRQVYEYPINQERFPWFYDRETWIDLLDLLFSERANVVYLWSGHPFASFVTLEDYPEAQEVTDDELRQNRELLTWLAAEADRRGIWIVVKFYNIHIPLPFAEHHGIPLHQPAPTPLTSDYTRKSIAAFVNEFPNVGLYVCLGEVLQGDIYGAEWFVDTILAGVQDGIAASGRDETPPVIVRAHAIDLQPVLARALEVYPRLFTEAKFNGESLTTWNPRGKWQGIHRELAAQGSLHIVNVHILANLEPFRFGAVSFIQKSVLAITHRLESHGLHLYPLFYWEWPLSPDEATPRLRQIDRDWIWYAAWLRYAWRADRDLSTEREHWIGVLARRFGDRDAAAAALDAYEAMGQIAPRLVRRLGITEGNRQTLSLGMTMSQLTNAARHRPWADLWDSHAPAGERLEEYARREVLGQPHQGETPVSVVDDTRFFADRAVAAIERGRSAVKAGHAEYERLGSDAQMIALLEEFYRLRVAAAVDIVAYREDRLVDEGAPTARLHRAAELIDRSVAAFERLTALADRTYLYANSMQTPQRKVPFPDGATYSHWRDCLPLYIDEARNFRANLARLEAGAPSEAVESAPERFEPVPYALLSDDGELFTVRPGASVFADADSNLRELASELDGLTGVRVRRDAAFQGQIALRLRLDEPGHILVGYFQSTDPVWLQVPDLEVDTHADARGGLEPVLRAAAAVDFLPSVNVHAFAFEAGEHTLALGTGAYVVLGAVRPGQEFTGRTALGDSDDALTLDWLYESPSVESREAVRV
ncbi:MAG: hypothetical protein K0R99_2744 [Microbacterium sp.]|jgi:hypothetical protein|uniref:hypothetical protein n=1 Tax=Microbacterium sp. TaxID=51671 RepID=UPI002625379D|nr:hypothetical protein [Microbacterium sp.]MDF2561298.1 hypothetical protein [Microbacterium sp.]